jgi:hypothetical protein
MSVVTRIILVLGSLFIIFFIGKQVNKGKIEIGHSLFWILFSLFLLFVSIFPGIVIFFSGLLGFQSSSNMIFLLVIFILLIKEFLTTAELSRLKEKLENLTISLALKEKTNKLEK